MTPSAKLKQLWDARIAEIVRERDEARERQRQADLRCSEVTEQLALRVCAEGCDKEELLTSDRELRAEVATLTARLAAATTDIDRLMQVLRETEQRLAVAEAVCRSVEDFYCYGQNPKMDNAYMAARVVNSRAAKGGRE